MGFRYRYGGCSNARRVVLEAVLQSVRDLELIFKFLYTSAIWV